MLAQAPGDLLELPGVVHLAWGMLASSAGSRITRCQRSWLVRRVISWTCPSRWSQSSRISIASSSRYAPGKLSMPSLRTARATDRASIWSDFPASRSPRRETPISLGGTLTTRSPEVTSARSRWWDTCRQSSSAHTTSGSSWCAHCSAWRCPASSAAISRSPTDLAGPGIDGGECVGALVGIRSNHDHRLVPSFEVRLSGSPADRSELGRLPRSDEVTPVIPDGGGRHNGLRSGTSPTNRLRVSPPPART